MINREKIRNNTTKFLLNQKRERERAGKFQKSNITFWVNAVSEPKYKPNSAAMAKSLDITYLEITSVLPCLNCFYCEVNLKLINSFKIS